MAHSWGSRSQSPPRRLMMKMRRHGGKLVRIPGNRFWVIEMNDVGGSGETRQMKGNEEFFCVGGTGFVRKLLALSNEINEKIVFHLLPLVFGDRNNFRGRRGQIAAADLFLPRPIIHSNRQLSLVLSNSISPLRKNDIFRWSSVWRTPRRRIELEGWIIDGYTTVSVAAHSIMDLLRPM